MLQTRRKMKQTINNESKNTEYDATNTSTSMIIMNNKHGKSSRLWKKNSKAIENSSVPKVDPERHTRESYSRRRYHAACHSSDSPPPRFEPSIKLDLDFSDRPPSYKVGDMLYKAKTSVNKRRHRHCSAHVTETSPVTLPKIKTKTKSAPVKGNDFSQFHKDAWNQLYVRLQNRLCVKWR